MPTQGKKLQAIDLFAGPGGWDLAAKTLGFDPLGIELDDAACATRAAAGLRTLQCDVAALDPVSVLNRMRRGVWCEMVEEGAADPDSPPEDLPDDFPVDLLIASPPCPTFSSAGKGEGMNDLPLIYEAADYLARNGELRWGDRCSDPRSELVLEPLRWALALEPRFLAWEQVPPVLPFWEHCAEILRRKGWNVATFKIEAERFGVPQTRERAILMADREQPVHPPRPTHQRYVKGEPQRHEVTLEGEVLPWVSMAEALGWVDGPEPAPAPTVSGGGTGSGGGVEVFAGTHARRRVLRSGQSVAGGERAERSQDEPAVSITSRADNNSWVTERPAPTIVTTRRSKDGILVGRQLPEGEGENVGGHNWTSDPRISQPGRHDPEESGSQQKDAIRVSLEEAAVLQSFPPDYPFQGTKSQRYLQVGNAVPPLLAKAILEALIPAELLAQIQTPESQAA